MGFLDGEYSGELIMSQHLSGGSMVDAAHDISTTTATGVPDDFFSTVHRGEMRGAVQPLPPFFVLGIAGLPSYFETISKMRSLTLLLDDFIGHVASYFADEHSFLSLAATVVASRRGLSTIAQC